MSQTLVFALVTAYGYYCAYKFEVGYCSHFRIPEELIKIDSIHIAITVAAMVGFIWIVLYISSLYPRGVFDKNQKWWSRVVGIVMLIVGVSVYMDSIKQWGLALIMAGFLAAVVYFDVTKTPIFFQSPISAFVHNFISERAGFWTMRFVVYAYLASGVVLFAGASVANGQERFLVPIGNPNMAVIKIYGDTLICAKVDFEKKEIYPVLFFYSVSSDFSKGLESKRIKGMKVVDAKEP